MKPTLTSFLALALSPSISYAALSTQCKCGPTDACWPSTDTWNELNETVSGRLIRSTALGAPCHDPTFEAAECEVLQDGWYIPDTHINSSSSIQFSIFSGRPCSPFTAPNATCGLGKEVQYAINVTSATDVAAGIAFAKENNVRLVIRNTGHDILGKSTGYGGLALWTHGLQSIDFMDSYDGPGSYSGPAVKVGAGVEGVQVVEAAEAQGRVVVSAECPSVGLAGGYIQGGGHSALSSIYGLGADQILAFEAVTGEGEYIQVDVENNSDLLWAMSGGGASTYAVALSATIKTYPDMTPATASISFTETANVSFDTWWEGASFYLQQTPQYTDAGCFSNLNVGPGAVFTLAPLFCPTMTNDTLKTTLQPVLDKLDSLKIPYNASFASYPSYLEAFAASWPLCTSGATQTGSWLLPRSTLQNNTSAYLDTLRTIIEAGALLFLPAVRPTLEVAGNVTDNAVLPAWRDTQQHTVILTLYNDSMSDAEVTAQAANLTTYVESVQALAPQSGAYLNEGDVNQLNWQEAFYGDNYHKLLEIKQKYDPDYVFYAKTAVGSEVWTEQSDGTLCPA